MTEAEKQVQWLEGWLVDPPPHAVYGEQWGKVTDPPMCGVFAHLCDHLALEPRTVVEIGPGGGRWTREIASRLNPHAKLILVDGTDAARPTLDNMLGHPFDMIVSPDGNLSEIPNCSVDLLFSFDVFVHFDNPLFLRYMREIYRIMRPGGRLMLHYAQRWDHPNVVADPTNCFIPPNVFALDILANYFTLGISGAQIPIPRGFGSMFVSVTRNGG